MRSRLYTGTTSHSRVTPAKNAFRYPVYYLGLDLDELDEIGRHVRVLSYNRANLMSVWDRDHGPRDGSALRPWIEEQCARAGVDITGGRVLLLTFPRVFGARFYPVSFWYCYGTGGAVVAVLAEVHNTHRDHHNYLLHDGGRPFDFSAVHTLPKEFFVSPFMPTEGVEYQFTVGQPGDRIRVSVTDVVAGQRVLTSTVDVVGSGLTDAALLRALAVHGPISIIALIRIHWQALKLLAKRLPFFVHTPPPSQETTL